MSHFTVAVLTAKKPTMQDIANALAPYQENNMGDCPAEYLEFKSVTAEEKEDFNNGTLDKVLMPNGNYRRTNDELFKKEITAEEYIKAKDDDVMTTRSYGDNPQYWVYDYTLHGGVLVKVSYKKHYKTFKNYMKEMGYEIDPEMSDYGYWHNPNAKWDWYQVGGRWAGKIEVLKDSESGKEEVKGEISWGMGLDVYLNNLKPNTVKVDSARIKDIKQIYPEKIAKLKRQWELFVEKQEPTEAEKLDHDFRQFYRTEYYLEKYKTKERYADLESRFSTYAVLDKNGVWHEAGKMGWFGSSNAEPEDSALFMEKYKEFVFDNAGENDWLTVVDCHI